jgi:hypothetical protein
MDKLKFVFHEYQEIILPVFFSLIMSVVHSIKVGKTKIINIFTEGIVSFMTGWIAYYILKHWYHIEYNVICGMCGFAGYLSPQILIGFEKLLNTFFTIYNDKIKTQK